MEHEEQEMLVEYSEMAAFNFKSKEYQEIKKDYKKCKEKAEWLEAFLKNLVKGFTPEYQG